MAAELSIANKADKQSLIVDAVGWLGGEPIAREPTRLCG